MIGPKIRREFRAASHRTKLVQTQTKTSAGYRRRRRTRRRRYDYRRRRTRRRRYDYRYRWMTDGWMSRIDGLMD